MEEGSSTYRTLALAGANAFGLSRAVALAFGVIVALLILAAVCKQTSKRSPINERSVIAVAVPGQRDPRDNLSPPVIAFGGKKTGTAWPFVIESEAAGRLSKSQIPAISRTPRATPFDRR